MAKKPAKAPDSAMSARDRLMRERAARVADKYMPDPKAAKESGPWAAWALERIDQLEAELAEAKRPKVTRIAPAPTPAEKPKKLTAKEMAFCQEYIIDLNATQAAIRAGYSAKTAGVIGYENLQKPHIRAVIADLKTERNRQREWDAGKLYDRLGDQGDADIAELYGDDGCFLPVREWPILFRQGLVVGVKTKELWEYDEDGNRVKIGEVVEVKFEHRLKVQELLGKHVQVQAFREQVEHDLSDPVKRLYAQIAGVGIAPVVPTPHAPGLGVIRPNAIRPIEQPPEGEPA